LIGGPGIDGTAGAGSVGWMPDHRRVWFCSEESGYSHLYTVDIFTHQKRALTSGNLKSTRLLFPAIRKMVLHQQ
jgi:hypothetical protein